MKKIFVTFAIIISVLGMGAIIIKTLPVGAIDLTTAQAQRVQNLKTRANTEISRRLTVLGSLSTKVSLLKKLSTEQISDFNTDIQGNITELTSLKLKISADTDPATLQTDVKSIVTDYRIFALYIPKVHLLAGVDAANDITTNLTALATKLQAKITTDQQAGKDVESLQIELADMQTKDSDAVSQSTTMTTLVIPLVPAGYPGNLDSLQNARAMLETIRDDIRTARSDAQQIITGLKGLQ